MEKKSTPVPLTLKPNVNRILVGLLLCLGGVNCLANSRDDSTCFALNQAIDFYAPNWSLDGVVMPRPLSLVNAFGFALKNGGFKFEVQF